MIFLNKNLVKGNKGPNKNLRHKERGNTYKASKSGNTGNDHKGKEADALVPAKNARGNKLNFA